MKNIIAKIRHRLIEKPFLSNFQSRVQKELSQIEDFSIISNNCFGGDIYRDLNKSYGTPTAGLFIPAPDFVLFLQDFKKNIKTEVREVNSSKYSYNINHPIGLIGDDIEVHFLHYDTFKEGKEKWSRRSARINFERLFIIMCERDFCTNETIQEFDQLPFNKKICFTTQQHPLNSTHQIQKFKNLNEIPGADVAKYDILKSFDLISWIKYD